MKVETGRMMGSAVDFHDVACAVIEDWAASRQPDASNFRWVSRVPRDDWQYDLLGWTREISDIHRQFERRVGFPVPMTAAEKRKTAGFALIKTHFILVRKAETISGLTVLKELLA